MWMREAERGDVGYDRWDVGCKRRDAGFNAVEGILMVPSEVRGYFWRREIRSHVYRRKVWPIIQIVCILDT